MPDKPEGTDEQQGAKQDTTQSPPKPLAAKEGYSSGVHRPESQQQQSTIQQTPTKGSRMRRFFSFFSKSEWINVFLTAVIAGTGVVGIILVIQGGNDTARIRDAAEKQACAAHQFSDTAKLINGNINAAVGKLALQAQDSERFFRTDERAWIEIGKIDTAIYPPDPPFGITFKYSIFLKNYGKTVATNVRVHIDNIDADTSFDDNRRAIRMSQDQLFKISGTNKRATEPNKPGPQTIAPQELATIPIFSGGQEPKKWGNSFRYTFVLGRIDYNDAFGKSHWMRFCYMAMNSRGELGHCTYGNEEDSNPENPN